MKKTLSVFCLLLVLGVGTTSQAEDGIFVKWVDDGDTILLSDRRRVRYIGIDAPEIDHHIPGKKNQKSEPFGTAARDFNRKILASHKIRLEFDSERHDRYGRTLAYVFLPDGTLINEKMIREGLAFCLPLKPNIRYEYRLLSVQQDAMLAKKGIWQNVGKGGENRIGNRHSKRFHLKNCPFAGKMTKKNRIVFSTEWDAFFAGFAPCRKCGSKLTE